MFYMFLYFIIIKITVSTNEITYSLKIDDATGLWACDLTSNPKQFVYVEEFGLDSKKTINCYEKYLIVYYKKDLGWKNGSYLYVPIFLGSERGCVHLAQVYTGSCSLIKRFLNKS